MALRVKVSGAEGGFFVLFGANVPCFYQNWPVRYVFLWATGGYRSRDQKKQRERERGRERKGKYIINLEREQQKDVICGVFMRRCKSWLRQKKCDSKGLFCGDFF